MNGTLSRNEVLNLFLKKFHSQQELETFITTSATLMAHFNDKHVGPLELQRFITAISEKMKAVNDNATSKEGAQPYSAWTLSFTGSTSVEAQSILNSYINYIAAQVVSQLREDLRERLALRVHTEKEALALERATLTTMRNIRIQRLSYSLQIAKAAGVIRPLYSHGQAVKDDPDFSIALGADGIARKLAIEQSMTDVSELNDVFRNRMYQLSKLENVTLKDISLPVFKYQQSASLPVKKDGPGTPVAILLAALLGVLYSCGNVLLRHELAIRRAVTGKGYPVSSHG